MIVRSAFARSSCVNFFPSSVLAVKFARALKSVLAADSSSSGSASPVPPPYQVQVQVQRRNPLRQQAQNDLFLQAYRLCAQARQYFPLSALFEVLHVDGKERLLPILRETESLPAQLEHSDEENADLKRMCEEAGWLMDESRRSALEQQKLVEKLLQEREEMAETIRRMEEELNNRTKIEKAAEVDHT